MSMSEERSNDEQPPGAATLLGLFAPPANAHMHGDDKATNSSHIDSTTDSPNRRLSSVDPSQEEKFPSAVESPTSSSTGRQEAPAGSTGHLMNLFAPKKDATSSVKAATLPRPIFDRQSTAPRSNISDQHKFENTPLIESSMPISYSLGTASSQSDTPLTSLMAEKQKLWMDIPSTQGTAGMSTRNLSPTMAPIHEKGNGFLQESVYQRCGPFFASLIREATKPSTIIGSFMYLLYHIVFCLALGSAIIRPNNPTSILGLMTKTAALGTIAASSAYW